MRETNIFHTNWYITMMKIKKITNSMRSLAYFAWKLSSMYVSS